MARWVWFSVLILFVAGCSSTGIPRATPTVAPTNTPEQGTPIVQAPSRTPMITRTSTTAPTSTATATATATATVTALPSETNTANPSETPEPSATNTPTLTTTLTPSPAPTDTPTNTATRRPTALPLIGEPTDTPSPTSTNTPIPSDTPTPTATLTPTVTATDAPTNTATVTPSPLPTNTPNPTATDTPLPTTTDTQTPALPPTLSVEQIRATVSARQTANAPTATPTFDLTQIAEAVFATETAFPPTATARAAQTATALVTNTPAPTLDTTPTFVTATPGIPPFTLTPITDLGIVTPVVVGESTTAEFSETVTPVPTSTFVFPTVPPVLAPPTLSSNWQEQIITRNFTNIGTQSYTVGAVIPLAQGSVGYGISASGDILPQLYARNPANANSYVRTNTNGTFYVSNNGQEYIPAEPFSPYVGSVGSPAQNDYFVSAVAWSANGRYVAFVIDGDRGGHPSPTGEDGVHYLDLETGGVVTVVRDCPYEGHPGCQLGGGRDFHGQTTDVTWSPGSTRILVRQRITDEWAAGTDRGALLIVPLDQPSEQQPITLRYDFGSWTNDGRRVVVSGQSPNNGVIIGTVNPDNTDLQIILDGSSISLWIQNAVQRPDGSFVALGRPAGESAVRIIDQSGNFLTAPIGTSAPQSVTWNSNRSAVSIIAGGRQYIAYLDGRVNEVLLGSEVPGGSAPLPADEQAALVPSGVVEGSRFGPGDQAQIQSEQLNIRTQPGVNAAFVGAFLQRGEYVRVLAGPVSVDGYEWWQVTTADGRLGWVAGNIGGFQTLTGT